MTLRSVRTQAFHYGAILLMLLLGWAVAHLQRLSFFVRLFDGTEHAETLVILFGLVIILALGFLVYELAKPTVLPSFVLALLFGMAVRDALTFLTESPVGTTTLITVGAVFILFGGGLETPFSRFRELLQPILALAIGGTLLTALLLSSLLGTLAPALGAPLPFAAILLLGAALASTDPAAIIPCLRRLVFDRPRIKHIAVCESAINDVVGAVLVASLVLVLRAGDVSSVPSAYAEFFSIANLRELLLVLAVGAVAGLAGFGILQAWSMWKQRVATDGETDAALFFAVPLAVFTLASIAGGSGYLAVFVTGLLFSLRSHMHHVEHYFNSTIEAFMKPTIFVVLGALVDPAELRAYADIGLLAGLAFMLVLRPLVVVVSLLPFAFTRHRFSARELLFLSFVRETGVIPAALLIAVQLSGVPGTEGIVAVGLWIILITLIVQPPLTPFVAKALGIAHEPVQPIRRKHVGPVAVLCSRGFSFPERMQTVVEWAKAHGVENIALLHCPEDKFTPAFVSEVRTRAEQLFTAVNDKLRHEGHHTMHFEFLCGPGLLQENIESLIDAGDVSIIFVGSKMLDYRIEDVKRLSVPFYFL